MNPACWGNTLIEEVSTMNKSNTIFLMILFLIFACGSALFLTPEVLAQDNPPAGESVSEEELIPEEETDAAVPL